MAERAEESPRITLGLDAASTGDVKGAHTFALFVEREAKHLGLLSDLPRDIKERFQDLARDADRLAAFCDGFRTGVQQPKVSDHQS